MECDGLPIFRVVVGLPTAIGTQQLELRELVSQTGQDRDIMVATDAHHLNAGIDQGIDSCLQRAKSFEKIILLID